MITYFKSQKDLSEALIYAIDSYWRLEISEQKLIEYLNTVFKNNRNKIINESDELTSVVKQRLGKKRLNLIIQILNIKEEENNK